MGSGPTEPGGAPVAMTGWVTLGNGEVRKLANLGSRLGARILDAVLILTLVLILVAIGIGGIVVSAASGDGNLVLGSILGLIAVGLMLL